MFLRQYFYVNKGQNQRRKLGSWTTLVIGTTFADGFLFLWCDWTRACGNLNCCSTDISDYEEDYKEDFKKDFKPVENYQPMTSSFQASNNSSHSTILSENKWL